jgi:hypothetical protein
MFKKLNLKSLSYLLIGLLLGSLIPIQSLLADTNIKLIINNQQITCDPSPQIINNRVFVPISFVGQALNCDVLWDGSTNAVVVQSKSAVKIDPVVNVNTDINKSGANTTGAEPVNNGNVNNPLHLDNIGDTTYQTYPNENNKTAYVTVVITNTSDKYISFTRLKPILNVNDGRNYDSALDSPLGPQKDNGLAEGGYFKPNSTVTLTYWARIPNDIEIIRWELP